MDPPITEVSDGQTTWRFDRAFLTSNWTCIWGRGCLGILSEPAPGLGHGCCSVGAELDGIEEARRISALADALDPSRFEHHAAAADGGVFSDSSRSSTRVVDGACIFLNRAGFVGGAGARCTCPLLMGTCHPSTSSRPCAGSSRSRWNGRPPTTGPR